MTREKILQIQGVSKTYHMGQTTVQALRNVSIDIEQGEFLAIIGQSGSGKSTLLNIIGLLDRPSEGHFIVAGRDTATLGDDDLARLRSETIGFVFQQFHLLQRITAQENVELPLIYAKSASESADAVDLLQRVGIGNRLHHRPNELSGGQQQRVAIARALIRKPLILLADEPTGNLDSQSGKEILQLLRELNAEGITVILVTHEPNIAANADRTIRLHDGLIVEDVRKNHNHSPVHAQSIHSQPLKNDFAALLKPWLMNLRQAVRSLLGNKFRTCLSALGIVIGIAAVIAMMALGEGAQNSMKKMMAGLGANRLIIHPNYQNIAGARTAGGTSRLTLQQVEDITNNIPTAAAAAPIIDSSAQAIFENKNMSANVIGTLSAYQTINAAVPASGRFFTDVEAENRERLVVLGYGVATNLFGTSDPLGQTIRLNKVPFTVIGVLPTKGSSGWRNEDDMVVIPVQTAMKRLLGKDYFDQIYVDAISSETTATTFDALVRLMRTWPPIPGVQGDSYEVFNLAAIQKMNTAIVRTFSMFLATVAAISLVVGGIGIMNIMLVSVTERTKEIGLRKALGAKAQDIQKQFLIEAIVLCLAGGMIGILLGWGIILIAVMLTQWELGISLFSVLLATGFSVAVGTGFGFWPAYLASHLDPIEALRHE